MGRHERGGGRTATRKSDGADRAPPAPIPVHCPGCGARLADRLGAQVVVRVRVRAGQTKRIDARDAEITRPCGRVRRSTAARTPR
jgi:hypothetical protein